MDCLVRAVRNTIVIIPSLIITQAKVDRLVGILDKPLAEAAAALFIKCCLRGSRRN